ncbi:ABC transporter substrate-binding protein [Winogradskyella sp. KYW1333]|uniref:ABC transporter substrate-binding protein n=1 Tax=Winogradskyella sp. KYW1333 TaxID=2282123 RepID=UPI000DF120B9|nr:ABC transporter substrate-binding protein [Winogradskyella sp. KYW1333]RCT55127.1 ABC transporter substrate-binding protein [Winogradskyella sp. KYW1333]
MPLKLHTIHTVFLTILICLVSCKSETSKEFSQNNSGNNLNLKYATGFSANDYGTHIVLEIKNPWPKASKTYKYALLKDNGMTPQIGYSFDGIIKPINNLVVTSTTHIPSLELLGVENSLVGFPGTDYISSEKTRKRIETGDIRELGKNEGINTEVLLELNPDVVIGFGVDGVNKTFETIKKAGIPVIYNGDWVESSSLAKAEWIKFFGILFNKEKEADSIFKSIERNYLEAKSQAKQASNRPTVFSGAMHKDVWYLPNGSSPEAEFLKDANVDYLWSDTTGNGSLALSFEAVLAKAKNAEIWLSPSYYTSFDQLKEASELYTNFKAFKTKNIYTFSRTTGSTGGVLYYELGTSRPDLILKDLIKICHPERLKDYSPYFFKKLK